MQRGDTDRIDCRKGCAAISYRLSQSKHALWLIYLAFEQIHQSISESNLILSDDFLGLSVFLRNLTLLVFLSVGHQDWRTRDA
jgi:hypothetical protein